jgi:6-pyruvoyltetrahydropterin/6-carboxytetrahydropterin synthase
VTIQGRLNKEGIVLDFGDFKKIVQEKVLEKLDHQYLNDIIENPTAENITAWIWERLEKSLNLYELKLWETPTSFATYRGEKE